MYPVPKGGQGVAACSEVVEFSHAGRVSSAREAYRSEAKNKDKPCIPVAPELPYSCSELQESKNYLMVGLNMPALPAGGCYEDYTK